MTSYVEPSQAELLMAVKENNVEVIRLAQANGVDLTFDYNNLFRTACIYWSPEILQLLLQDPRIDPGDLDNDAFEGGVMCGDQVLTLLLLQHYRPTQPKHACYITWADENGMHHCIDQMLAMGFPIEDMVNLGSIKTVQTLFFQVCNGMQELDLPALVTLEILDALIPNSIRMAAKWDLIVAVKHFHDKKK